MEFDSIQFFLTLAHCKSFSQTAEIMNVTQPTVSRHIKNLESELGIQLLDSRYRTAELSPAGKIMLKYFETYTQDFQSVLYRAQRFASQNNSLILVLLEDLDTTVSFDPILRFQSDSSNFNINIHIETTSSFQLPFYLNRGIFDIIITLDDNFFWIDFDWENIEKQIIASGEMRLYYSNQHSSAKLGRQPLLSDFINSPMLTTSSFNLSHIPDQNVLMRSENGPISIIDYYKQLLGFEPQISYKRDLNEVQLNLDSGSGFVVASQFCRFNKSNQINYIPISVASNIVAVWKKSNDNPLIKKIIEFLTIFNQT